MASKQIGKLRQWAGEKVSRSNKVTLTEDFQELETDVNLRGAGVERLSLVSDAYIKALTKKIEIDVDTVSGKIHPVEALGLVMIGHGNEFGDGSVYGNTLVKFGREHCRIATLQEEYSAALKETYHRSLEEQIGSIKEYYAQRKKLDSRRLALDAAMTKVPKTKKVKEKAEAEQELDLARARYDEMSTDVQERMLGIQKHEIQQLADLTKFLKTELAYVSEYYATLLKLQEDWPDITSVSSADLARPQGTAHIFARQPAMPGRKSTTRSPTPSPVRDQPRREPDPSGDRAQTPNGVPGAAKSSSRHRSDSVATSASTGAPGAAKRVTGWVSSVGRSRKNSVSKKNFQSLDGDDSDADEPRPSGDGNAYGSEPSLSEGPKRPTPSRPGSVRIRQPPPPPVGVSSRPSSAFSTYSKTAKPKIRTVQAIYDFHATAAGELAFEKGDIIRLLEDGPVGSGTDGWVKGELKGQIGLIPFNYTREVPVPPVERRRTDRTIMKNDDPTGFDSYSGDDASNSGEHGLAASRTPFDDDRAGQEQSFFPPPNPKSSSSPDLFLRREHLNASASAGPNAHDEFYHQHPINKQHHAHRYQNEAYSPTHDNFGDSDGGDSVQEVHRDKDGLLPPADSLLSSHAQRPSMTRRQLSSIITGKKPPPPPPAARRTQTSVGGTYGNDNSKPPSSQRPLAPPRNRTVREQGSYDSFKSPFDT